MKRIAIWMLVICLILVSAACGGSKTPSDQPDAVTTDAPGNPDQPAETDAPAQAEADVYYIVKYEVGELAYEGQQLTDTGMDNTSLTLNTDHTGKLILMGEEMEIGWTDAGEITIGGMPFYKFERIDADTVKVEITGTFFTLSKNGAAPAPEVTEAPAPEVTEAPAPEVTEAPAPEVTDAPAPEVTDAPAAGGEVTLEGKIGFGPVKVPVTAVLPAGGWCAEARSSTVYFYNVPDVSKAYSDSPRISFEFKESLDKINFYLDTFENLQELDARTIGGIEMPGRSYKNVGMDWIEYYGEIAEGAWVSVRISGVDISAGTEGDAILSSAVFGAPHE